MSVFKLASVRIWFMLSVVYDGSFILLASSRIDYVFMQFNYIGLT